jgi:hypothetical protein
MKVIAIDELYDEGSTAPTAAERFVLAPELTAK